MLSWHVVQLFVCFLPFICGQVSNEGQVVGQERAVAEENMQAQAARLADLESARRQLGL